MRKTICLLALLLFALPGTARSLEIGLATGGNIEIHDLASEFAIGPYLSSDYATRTTNKAVFFLPVLFGFPKGPADLRLGVVPTFEWDQPFGPQGLHVTPQLGLSLSYLKGEDAGGGEVHAFGVGILPGVGVKYILNERWVFRFVPVGLEIVPWTYSSGGPASETDFTVAYRISAGFGYRF